MKANHSRRSGYLLLPDDFASQVIRRVEELKHRRTIRRRSLAATAVIALTFGAFFVSRRLPFSNPPVSVAQQPQVNDRFAYDQSVSYQEQPVNLDLPDTYLLTNFAVSTGEAGWHSYDTWWSSNS